MRFNVERARLEETRRILARIRRLRAGETAPRSVLLGPARQRWHSALLAALEARGIAREILSHAGRGHPLLIERLDAEEALAELENPLALSAFLWPQSQVVEGVEGESPLESSTPLGNGVASTSPVVEEAPPEGTSPLPPAAPVDTQALPGVAEMTLRLAAGSAEILGHLRECMDSLRERIRSLENEIRDVQAGVSLLLDAVGRIDAVTDATNHLLDPLRKRSAK